MNNCFWCQRESVLNTNTNEHTRTGMLDAIDRTRVDDITLLVLEKSDD